MIIDLGENRRKTGANVRDLTLESCFKKGTPNGDDKYADKCLVVELRSFLSTMSFYCVAIVRTKSNRPKHVFYHTFQGYSEFRPGIPVSASSPILFLHNHSLFLPFSAHIFGIPKLENRRGSLAGDREQAHVEKGSGFRSEFQDFKQP